MKVVVIDDEKMALGSILQELKTISRISQCMGFQSSEELLEYVSKEKVDIAFLDINMRQMDGLTLAKKIKEIQPEVFLIFVTGYSEYAVQAFRLHATGYLLKPVSAKDIEEEIDNIQKLRDINSENKKLRIQCFGNFEVFFNEEPLPFQRAKTKELLAYLIDRNGASSSIAMICGILWEDNCISPSKKSQIRTFISELSHELEVRGLKEVLIKKRNSYAVNTKLIDCDYYRFLNMEARAVNRYQGEYMTQYSWAEMTLGLIERKKLQF